MKSNDLYIQPTAGIGFGGSGSAVVDVFRVAIENELKGTVPESEWWARSLEVDFMGGKEAASSEAITRYGNSVQHPGSPAETFALDIKPLLDLARSNETGYDGLWRYCRRDLLARSRSSQAGQKPPISRVSFVYYLEKIEPVIEDMLRSLASNGEVLNALRRQGFREECIGPKLRVAIIGGAEGGTFHGCAMPAAILVHSIARRLSIDIDLELWVSYRYRSVSSAESRLRSALGEQFSRDLEIAQTPGRQFELKTLSGFIHEANGELFSRCIPFEGYRRLYGKSGALALTMGEALAFRTVHRSAALIDANHAGNFLSRDRN